MRKNVMAIMMASLMLITIFSVINVSAQSGTDVPILRHFQPVSLTRKGNYWIEDVSYSPSEPSEGDQVVFTISVDANGEGHPHIAIYLDGSIQDMGMLIEFPSTTVLSIIWPAGDSHTVRIKVDPFNAYEESNEQDNIWQEDIESGEVSESQS